MNSLEKVAPKFAKNPLGIIALFIVLIYGFASLLVGTAGGNLEAAQRWPIIWFLVIFPFVVLFVFAWLVSTHHTKLYAPSDFRDEKLFIGVQPPEQRQRKLDQEIEALEPIVDAAVVDSSYGISVTQESNQRAEEFRKTYQEAERLAMRKLSAELNVPVREGVLIGQDSYVGAFDGAAVLGETIAAIEVKFVLKPYLPASVIDELLFRARTLDINLRSEVPMPRKLKLILGIVGDLDNEGRIALRERISKRVQLSGLDVDVRFFGLKQLRHEAQEGKI